MYINITSLIISIFTFLLLQGLISNKDLYFSKARLRAGFTVNQENSINENIKEDTKNNKLESTDYGNTINQNIIENKQNIKENNMKWYIEIPCISLKAKIEEGTTDNILNKSIGHFEDSSKEKGNIGLAAHNRGYEKNYFENVKKLKEGDKIFYFYNNVKIEYRVIIHKIIKDTDWTCLEETEDNRITLITCVENQPQYRRCVQAIQEK